MATKFSNLKLVSDGSTSGTFLLDENGNQVGLIDEITWRVSVGKSLAELEVRFIGVPIEIKGLLPPADAKYYMRPKEPKPDTEEP